MKTKSFSRILILSLVALVLFLNGCSENDEFETTAIQNDDGLKNASVTLYFKSVHDATFSTFNFENENGVMSASGSTIDEIELSQNHLYQCVLYLNGSDLNLNNLRLSYSYPENLNLTITKAKIEKNQIDGQVTEWKTGNATNGLVTVSVSNNGKNAYGSYSINLPVKIVKSNEDLN